MLRRGSEFKILIVGLLGSGVRVRHRMKWYQVLVREGIAGSLSSFSMVTNANALALPVRVSRVVLDFLPCVV